MRALILTLILWCFAAQSLALAVAPACDQGAGPHGGHGAMMLQADSHGDNHGNAGMSGDHRDMPCCQDSADTSDQDLCLLTCAVGGCGAAVLVALEWQINALPSIAPRQPISPSPLAASQRNLLRPPIGA